MRKIVYILICAVLLTAVLPTFAVADASDAEFDAEFDANAFMFSAARELTSDMCELAADKTLVSLFGGSEKILSCAADVGNADFDSPTKAYILSGKSENFISQFGEATLTESQQELLGYRLSPATLFGLCNGVYGAEWLATATMLNVAYSYYRPDFPDADYIVVLETDGEYSSATAFYLSGDDGVISASTVPIRTESIPNLLDMTAEMQWSANVVSVD